MISDNILYNIISLWLQIIRILYIIIILQDIRQKEDSQTRLYKLKLCASKSLICHYILYLQFISRHFCESAVVQKTYILLQKLWVGFVFFKTLFFCFVSISLMVGWNAVSTGKFIDCLEMSLSLRFKKLFFVLGVGFRYFIGLKPDIMHFKV